MNILMKPVATAISLLLTSIAVSAQGTAQLTTIEIKGDRETGYVSSRASTATRSDTSIMDTPFSIQAVPEELIHDQQAYRLEDVVKNVSGMQSLPVGWSSAYETLQSRGFPSEPFRDGLRILFLTVPIANAEQVEVLKGPAAIQYGRIQPGGMVNVVTKKPQADAAYTIEQQLGSYDFSRTTADLTGALNLEKTLMYRVNLENLDKKTFVDNTFDKRAFFAGSLAYQPTQATKITLSYERRDEKELGNVGIPAIGNAPAPVAISSYYGEPGLEQHFMVDAINLRGEHKINDQWTVRGGLGNYKGDYKYANINGWSLTGSTLSRWGLSSNFDKRDTEDAFVDVQGKFEAWGAKHTVLIGADYHLYTNTSNWYGYGAVPDIDIYNPVYGGLSAQAFMNGTPDSFYLRTDKWNGIYLQDQATIADKWHLLLGGRYDETAMSSGYDDIFGSAGAAASLATAGAAVTTKTEKQFSPSVGLTYEATPGISVYASYTQAFGGTASTTLTKSGAMLDPEASNQIEVGAKGEFLDGRLNATFALYQLTKKNVATADPANPGFSLSIGEARANGFEVDVSGKITPSLSVTASYANNDVLITKSNNGDEGQRFANAPRQSGSVWLKYALSGETLQGLSVGGGVFAASESQGDNANTFQLPGYSRVDAYAAYKFRTGKQRVTAQLNVNNLLNTTYYPSAQSSSAIFPGEPRVVMLSLKLDI